MRDRARIAFGALFVFVAASASALTISFDGNLSDRGTGGSGQDFDLRAMHTYLDGNMLAGSVFFDTGGRGWDLAVLTIPPSGLSGSGVQGEVWEGAGAPVWEFDPAVLPGITSYAADLADIDTNPSTLAFACRQGNGIDPGVLCWQPVVPEPTGIAILGLGLAGAILRRKLSS